MSNVKMIFLKRGRIGAQMLLTTCRNSGKRSGKGTLAGHLYQFFCQYSFSPTGLALKCVFNFNF